MSTPKVVPGDAVAKLDERSVLAAVRSAFTELGSGRAVQPVQIVTPFPDGGDVIVYQAVLPEAGVYALKMSPYLPRSGGPATVTAWTMLVSLETGDPVLLIDAKALTAHRTAATSVLAVDLLAPSDAKRLAVIGAGPLAQAHVRYARQVRAFEQVSVYAPGAVDPAAFTGEITVSDTAASAVADAEVVMLCTSAAEPVIDIVGLPPATVVTSISTNAPRAHEIDPAALSALDVYCDYRPAAMAAAGDFVIAADEHGFSVDGVRGDLPGLLDGRDDPPSRSRPVFFRSVGLGIEDAAVALVALGRTS
jgi:L-arginine dehydrogenase